MDDKLEEDFDPVPLAETNVTLKLAAIQRRCSELLTEPDALTELSLEEPTVEPDDNNPYNRG